MPSVDVVILTWNDGELLDTAVASALGSIGVDVTVTVVDNGSAPAAVVVGDARVELVRNDENRGVAGGRNQGVALGRHPFVCLLDSDAALHPDSLRSMLAVLEGEQALALVGPVFSDQQPEASGGSAPTLTRKLRRSFGRTNVYASSPNVGTGVWWQVDFVIDPPFQDIVRLGAEKRFTLVATTDIGTSKTSVIAADGTGGSGVTNGAGASGSARCSNCGAGASSTRSS